MASAASSLPQVFAYTLRYDVGFAPNPFYGFCTLATCKAEIRRLTSIGDWILGVGSVSKGQGGKLVYAMRVEEKLHYDDYWVDPRFQAKRPFRPGSLKQRYGDNIYHRNSPVDSWIQEDGRHSLEDGRPNPDHIKRDTKYPIVLVSQSFFYYGDRAIEIPEELRVFDGQDLFTALRSYRRILPTSIYNGMIMWLEGLLSQDKIRGDPLDWIGHPEDVAP